MLQSLACTNIVLNPISYAWPSIHLPLSMRIDIGAPVVPTWMARLEAIKGRLAAGQSHRGASSASAWLLQALRHQRS